jgi:hypothetical protein
MTAAAGLGYISPRVQQGKILNPVTNRLILIGGEKYKELLSQGYTPDAANTQMLPPGGTSKAAA